MTWIYLSPHLDDVALSCGGLLWEQAQAGEEVSVWTLCAGDPPHGALSPFAETLHDRWQSGIAAAEQRRLEDIASCQRLEASFRHFSLPDCIYRRSPLSGEFLYASEADLWIPIHSEEGSLIETLSREIQANLPPQAKLVTPLALGGHVDHRLARAAAERLGLPLWYYADYPYCTSAASDPANLRQAGWSSQTFSVSTAGLHAWQEAVAAHTSQISTFWADLEEMQAAIEAYYRISEGVELWFWEKSSRSLDSS